HGPCDRFAPSLCLGPRIYGIAKLDNETRLGPRLEISGAAAGRAIGNHLGERIDIRAIFRSGCPLGAGNCDESLTIEVKAISRSEVHAMHVLINRPRLRPAR